MGPTVFHMWIFSCPGASLMAQWVKNLPANAGDTGDMGLIPGSGRFLGGGNGSPLLPGNPMDRGAWQATIQRVAKIRT